jgi:hypothetical protein
MAKFHGNIGFALGTVESPAGSGVMKEQFIEKEYFGEMTRDSRQTRDGEKVNDDISVDMVLSIVADEYLNTHIFAMRYVWWRGETWKITNGDVEHPRVNLRLGGIYNGQKAPIADPP